MAFVVSTVAVYLRTCFRLAETAGGVRSELFSNEDYFTALEFVPILVASLLFNAWHPGRCLGRAEMVGDSDGHERKGNERKRNEGGLVEESSEF